LILRGNPESLTKEFNMAFGTSSFGTAGFGSLTSGGMVVVSTAEVGALADASSQAASFSGSVAEAGTLADSFSNSLIFPLSVVESAALLDSVTGVTTYFLQVSEAGALVELIGAGAVLSATQADSAALSDWLAAGQIYEVVQNEVAALSDASDGVLVVSVVLVLGTAQLSDGPSVASGRRKLMNYYVLGGEVTMISSFADVNGLPVNPISVSAEVLKPDNTKVQFSGSQITSLGGGSYQVNYTPDQTGIYFYRFTGVGSNQVVAEAYFLVQRAYN
jgi:hypothetical protein